jgi:hypothetical protein
MKLFSSVRITSTIIRLRVIVLSPEEYLYSSALNYADLPEKLIEVILI